MTCTPPVGGFHLGFSFFALFFFVLFFSSARFIKGSYSDPTDFRCFNVRNSRLPLTYFSESSLPHPSSSSLSAPPPVNASLHLDTASSILIFRCIFFLSLRQSNHLLMLIFLCRSVEMERDENAERGNLSLSLSLSLKF